MAGVTNQSRHDNWVAVSKHFSEAMEAEFTSKQFKGLWSRIKESIKKNHDWGSQSSIQKCSKIDENDFVVIDGDDRTIRFRGLTERDRLCTNMRYIDLIFAADLFLKLLNEK